jgi:saccharopine dehydrogenase (NAD+, L-glutamate forming)
LSAQYRLAINIADDKMRRAYGPRQVRATTFKGLDMGSKRTYDLVVFGATGFTGELTAEYLARSAPKDCSWALAGRNHAKLEAVRDRLTAINPSCAGLPLLIAEVTDPMSLRAVAQSTRVVITTVGPFLKYGEPLVAACADAGTDYVDITGEPEFVDLMYNRHHASAERSGARLVHACGFDSIPHDLGAYFTVRQLPSDMPMSVEGVVRAGGTPSGATFQTAITAMSRPLGMLRAARTRAQLEQKPAERSANAVHGLPRRSDGQWLVPLPTLDAQIVARSARALSVYGPRFCYRHYAGVHRLPVVVASAVGLASLFMLAQVPPARRLLLARMQPGTGPSPEKRAASWFQVRFTGKAGNRTVVTQVSGGDPGYEETGKMLAESALCLAFDDLPPTAGQVTTAQAMGDALIDRLVKAGIAFDVVSDTAA